MQHYSTNNDQFLGEVQTYISGMQYCDGEAFLGEEVYLERDYINRHDRNAIRIKNLDSSDIGFIPRRVAMWLSPLWDDGKIVVTGTIPNTHKSEPPARHRGVSLNLNLFLTDKGQTIFETKHTIINEPDALHHIILTVFSELGVYKNPAMVIQLQQKLFSLLTRDALPDSHLVLSLFPYTARKIYREKYHERTQSIQSHLRTLDIAPGIFYKNLTMFPILSSNGTNGNYDLLNRVLKNKLVEIEEISDEGHVHEILFKNNSKLPVILPEGEILIGAKQNRVINVSVLVAANSHTCIPVSCVERGRWRYSSDKFESTDYAHSKLRGNKLASVHQNRSKTGEARSDQSMVWDEVSQHLAMMNVSSNTDSLVEGFKTAEKKTKNYHKNITLPDQTAGVIVCLGNEILGLDYFAKPDHFQEYWQKLSKSYFIEATTCTKPLEPTKPDLVENFIENIADNILMCEQPIGLGDEFMIESNVMTGTGVWYDAQLCHFSAFCVKDQ